MALAKNLVPQTAEKVEVIIMTHRKNNISVYSIKTDKKEFIVTLERIKNDAYGNPRFKAVLITTTNCTECYENAVYTFTGHYCSEIGEAQYIVNYHCNH